MELVAVAVVRGLYRFYHSAGEETAALKGVDLVLEAGEFVALMGPSGSGKSTMLACLAGLDDPDGGTVHIGGALMSRRPENLRARLRARTIGMLMQSGNLLEHLSVADNMRLQQHIARAEDPTGSRKILQRLGIERYTGTLPSQLSGGEVARAGLAVALAAAPALLICDEPTAEVDARTEGDIIGLIKERAHSGAAVLVATHSATLAAACDRIVNLANGRVVD